MAERRPRVLAGAGLLGLVPTLFLTWMTEDPNRPLRAVFSDGEVPVSTFDSYEQTGWEAIGPIAAVPLAFTVLVTLVWLTRASRGEEITAGLVYLVAAGGLHQTLSIAAHLLLPDEYRVVAWPAIVGLFFAALVAAGGLIAARAAARERRTLAQEVGLDG